MLGRGGAVEQGAPHVRVGVHEIFTGAAESCEPRRDRGWDEVEREHLRVRVRDRGATRRAGG